VVWCGQALYAAGRLTIEDQRGGGQGQGTGTATGTGRRKGKGSGGARGAGGKKGQGHKRRRRGGDDDDDDDDDDDEGTDEEEDEADEAAAAAGPDGAPAEGWEEVEEVDAATGARTVALRPVRPSILPLDASFSPALFLKLIHGAISFEVTMQPAP